MFPPAPSLRPKADNLGHRWEPALPHVYSRFQGGLVAGEIGSVRAGKAQPFLPGRLTARPLALDQMIGVRITAGDPTPRPLREEVSAPPPVS